MAWARAPARLAVYSIKSPLLRRNRRHGADEVSLAGVTLDADTETVRACSLKPLP